jgi:dihydroorotate dehydrogenase (fumarate)/dihydroorotate dehydrogenase
LGFGFVEIGSVSEHASSGNAGRPRLWRLPADEALRVHYGCPNDGAAAIAERLRGQNFPVPLGVNLVETNTGTPVSAEVAAEELGAALRHFVGIADYIALNLSCPNMPRGAGGLFDEAPSLANLLRVLARERTCPPLFLKITPPGAAEDTRFIDSVLETVAPFDFVKGFILNIPNRDPYETLCTPRAILDTMRGGITGPLLFAPTKAALAAWYARMDRKRHVLIGVGGIRSAEDAYAFLRSGASLVQLCTALVYRGPSLAMRINRGLARLLERDGVRNVAEAVGVDDAK